MIENVVIDRERTAGGPPVVTDRGQRLDAGPQAPVPWWVISRSRDGTEELHATRLAGGKKALPVFSDEGEAEAFVRLGPHAGNGWEPVRVGSGSLVALLSGPACRNIGQVLLDPPPGMLDDVVLGLLSVDRRILIESLLGQ